jgi:hypothetical protein
VFEVKRNTGNTSKQPVKQYHLLDGGSKKYQTTTNGGEEGG